MVQGQKSASEKIRTKKSYFSSAWEYVKLPFSLRVSKKLLTYVYRKMVNILMEELIFDVHRHI
jgi:hypothetical protein